MTASRLAIRPALVVGLPVLGALSAAGVIGVGVMVAGLGLAGAIATPGPPSPAAIASIPPAMLSLYQSATESACPSLPWQIVAAIGTVESDNGTSSAPGVASGANYAGAEGVMQFEPASFAEYAEPVPPGGAAPPSPYDPTDAVWAAVRMLCANGANSGEVEPAIFAYNHSVTYVDDVWGIAVSYGMAPDASVGAVFTSAAPAGLPGPGPTFPGDVAKVIAAAESQLGVAYVYGADAPGVGLDCSGLVAYAFAQAGIALPRTTFAQVDYGVSVSTSALRPGDLLFFLGGEPVEAFGHVGLYLGEGLMIEAPHTGAVVSITAVPTEAIEVARRIVTG